MVSERRSIPVVVPWYEPEDFELLRELAADDVRVPASYADWQREATAAFQRLLREGYTVQILTIRAKEYFAWLARTGRKNSQKSRLRFLKQLAGSAGSSVAVLRAAGGRMRNRDPLLAPCRY